MEFIVNIDNKKKQKLFEIFLKALEVEYSSKEKESPYNDEFEKDILRGEEDLKTGNTVEVNLDDIWK